MSFSDDFKSCMSSNGLPVPTVEDLNQAKEIIEQVHQAWEAAGGDEQMTIAALVALGAATGVDEEVLAALATAGAITVGAYIAACVGCMASAGVDQLKQLFASNPPQQFMTDLLAQNGIDLADTAAA